MSIRSDFATAGGEALMQPTIEYHRGCELCRRLEALHPGVRFNSVTVFVNDDEYVECYPDTDFIDVVFSLSGDHADLQRCGLESPKSVTARARTAKGKRFSGARYLNGLDLIAACWISKMLKDVRP